MNKFKLEEYGSTIEFEYEDEKEFVKKLHDIQVLVTKAYKMTLELNVAPEAQAQEKPVQKEAAPLKAGPAKGKNFNNPKPPEVKAPPKPKVEVVEEEKEVKITVDQVKEKALLFLKIGKKEAFQQLLESYSVSNLSGLPESSYPDVYSSLVVMINQVSQSGEGLI